MNKEIAEFLAFLKHEKNASPHTIDAYGRDLREVAAYLKEREVRWDRAENVILRGYLAELHEKKRKKSTIGRKLAALRSFYDFCVRTKRVAANPAKILSTPRQDRRVPSFLTEDETAELLDLPRSLKPLDLRDKAILELFYATGIRVSELVGIETADIHFGERLVRVRGKGKKERIVPFGGKAREALEDYGRARSGLVGKGTAGEAAFFVNYRGERLSDPVRPADGPQVHPADGGGPQDQPPLAPPFFRLPSPRPRGGPPRHPGAPRTRQPGHDREVHPRRPPAAPQRLQEEPPPQLDAPASSTPFYGYPSGRLPNRR